MQILIHILAVVAVLKVSGCWSIGGASVVAVIASKELCSSALDTEVTAGRARGGEGGGTECSLDGEENKDTVDGGPDVVLSTGTE